MMMSLAGQPGSPAVAVEAAILRESGEVSHAFSTRHGGMSRPPFATLNLGQGVGDDPAAVEENRRRFFGAFGVTLGQVVRTRQVHGSGVLRADAPVAERPECDALITDRPNLALVVSTADCFPILIHDPVRRAVAAVHAGWRGTAKRIVSQTLTAMREAYGTDAADCRAAIGPGIRRCCFEVDGAVTDAMATALPCWEAHASANRPGHWLLDLAAINRAILHDVGVRADRIEDVGLCTSCRNDLFFSHRAEKGRTGRMMNFILLTTEVRQGQG